MSYQRLFDISSAGGNRGEVRYFEPEDEGLEYAALRGPAALDASYVLSLPGAAPAAGSVLEFDQDGNASFIPTPAGGAADLQAAYNASTTPPQITLNATPDALTIDASVAGDIFALRNSSAADVARFSDANIEFDAPIDFDVDWTDFPGTTSMLDWSTVVPASGSLVGAMIRNGTTITVDSALFIMSAFLDQSVSEWTVTPGFAVSTLFLAQPTYKTTTAGIAPAQAFTLAAQPIFQNDGGGGSVPAVPNFIAVSARATLQTLQSGDVMNMTNYTGLDFAAGFGTVSGSSVSFGNLRAVWAQAPLKGIFFPGAGVETIASYAGLYQNNIGFNTGNPIRCAVRSFMTSGTNKWFLLNSGSAHSDHGAGHIYFNDNRGIALGGAGLLFDSWIRWDGTNNALGINFNSTGDDIRLSSPAANRFIFGSNDNTANELDFDFKKFAFGQSGSVGNNVGIFVAQTRSTGLAGEWSDFLLTQAGNITVDHAMGGVFGWTVNAPSITLGTGTVTTAGALNVGGNVNQGSVNRFGVRILSNPSGGSGVNAALWVTAGLSRFDGRVDINRGIALGGGAAPTLGTIGGSGPGTAAQAQWLEVDIAGVAHWIPVWT